MKTNQKYATFSVYAIALMMVASSCKVEDLAVAEATKEMEGDWQIKTALRNGVDITEKFDFTQFNIRFNNDGSYTIDQPLPFIVSGDGNYQLDDPQYPFQISFSEQNGSGEASSGFEYPIVNGVRELTLTFSPGCESNSYRYTLIKK